MAACKINEKYSWIECDRPAWEGDPEGLCILHSREEDKDKENAFTEAVKEKLEKEDYGFQGVFFPGDIDIFNKHKFKKDASFAEATFSEEALFSHATFSEGAYFSGADFSGDALFTVATFSEVADFSEATFSGAANFYGATFSGWANFCEATFSEEARFSHATFSEEAYFYGATFLEEADFSLSTVAASGRLILRSLNPADKKDPRPPFRADLRQLRHESGASITFQDLSLAQAKLAGTDMTHMTLRNVDWHHYHPPLQAFLIKGLPSSLKKRLQGRQTLYDDFLVRERAWKFWELCLNYGWREARRLTTQFEELKQEDYARVEELYRGLMLNYGAMGDHKRVGDFHYGEMEMHRRASPWRRLCSLYSAYWALSGYGERPLRAFIWLVLLIPLWAGLVWGLGFDQAGSQNPITYGDTLLFIFEKVTFQRPDWPTDIKNVNWLGKFLSGLSVLLIPGQAALFILALRNRLGRRR